MLEPFCLCRLSGRKWGQFNFLQKVYAETLIGHRHDVWDVHASDGRWWVVTNPTNLYSQTQFPNMDYAVTFHMGLCIRVPRTQQQKLSDIQARPFGEVFVQLQGISDALSQANGVPDYQPLGVRCREVLLAFVSAVQEAAIWTEKDLPKEPTSGRGLNSFAT